MAFEREGWQEVQLLHHFGQDEEVKLRSCSSEVVAHPTITHFVYVKDASREKLSQALGCYFGLTDQLDIDPEALLTS